MSYSSYWVRSPAEHLNGLWRFHAQDDFHPCQLQQHWQLLRKGPHALIFRLGSAGSRIIKLIRHRSTPRDQLRQYFQCQARREYNGGYHLQRLGLSIPERQAWGVAISPLSEFESILIMEQLTDFVSGLRLIRCERDASVRASFLRTFASGIATIYGHGYIHKDCHFENVCHLTDGRLAWIDTDIRKSASMKTQRRGLKKTLSLLRDTARADIETQEWRAFVQNLKDALTSFPNGSELRHEIQ